MLRRLACFFVSSLPFYDFNKLVYAQYRLLWSTEVSPLARYVYKITFRFHQRHWRNKTCAWLCIVRNLCIYLQDDTLKQSYDQKTVRLTFLSDSNSDVALLFTSALHRKDHIWLSKRKRKQIIRWLDIYVAKRIWLKLLRDWAIHFRPHANYNGNFFHAVLHFFY